MTRQVIHTLRTVATFSLGILLLPGAGVAQSISDVTFDWSTHRREASETDNWPITWAADGNQYTHGGDGFGWNGNLSTKQGNIVVRISGTKDGYTGEHRFTSDGMECGDLCGKSYGIIALHDVLYMWLAPNSGTDNWNRQTLYKSTDDGATWSSTDVEFTESDGIGAPTILQFGQDNSAARDEYVYIYWTVIQDASSWAIQKPGKILLSRVPTTEIETQSSYEWVVGLNDSAQPTWGSLKSAVPVFEDQTGVMRNSAIYNPGLDTYILVTEHSEDDKGNLNMAQAPAPWGPFDTFFRESGWPTGGEIQQNTFFWNLSPKWLSNDGRDFVLVFTGKDKNDAWNSVEGSFTVSSTSNDTVPPAPPTNLRVDTTTGGM